MVLAHQSCCKERVRQYWQACLHWTCNCYLTVFVPSFDNPAPSPVRCHAMHCNEWAAGGFQTTNKNFSQHNKQSLKPKKDMQTGLTGLLGPKLMFWQRNQQNSASQRGATVWEVSPYKACTDTSMWDQLMQDRHAGPQRHGWAVLQICAMCCYGLHLHISLVLASDLMHLHCSLRMLCCKQSLTPGCKPFF